MDARRIRLAALTRLRRTDMAGAATREAVPMAKVFQGRYTADIDGEFVVFLIGMRINKPLDVRGWWPTFVAMRPMVKQLEAQPEAGLLRAQQTWMNGGPALVQHWRSFEHLDRFARDPDFPHRAAWHEWVRTAMASGAVGIWHETYKVGAGQYEAIYSNMPRTGLAAVSAHVPVAVKGRTAARRIGVTELDEPAVRDPGEEAATPA
jgi:hypothetical protein